jgi:rubrerythrin
MSDNTSIGHFREITIPGDVLDDVNLSDGAKIMYGKIARLSWKNGFCSASNYFLDGTKSGRNASRFIAELKNGGFILIENEKSKFRKIRICSVESRIKGFHIANSGDVENFPTSPNLAGSDHIANSGDVENIPTTPNLAGSAHIANSSDVENIPTTPNLAGSEPLLRQIWQGETAHIASSGEQTLEEEVEEASSSTLKINKIEKTLLSPEEIKQALLTVDKTLFLDNFYPKAAAFMAKHSLDLGYVSFIYKETENSDYRSFNSMFYTLFFTDSRVEKYKILKQPDKAPPPPDDFKCPVCGAVHDENDEACPNCSLPRNPTPQKVSLFRELLTFSIDRRNEYLKRENVIYSEFKGDFVKLKIMIASLRNEFNLGEIHETPSRSYRP